jgi:hypothetical protein
MLLYFSKVTQTDNFAENCIKFGWKTITRYHELVYAQMKNNQSCAFLC